VYSSRVLRKYLESPECRLKRLGLNKADVDDTELGRVMESMRRNRSVTALDLGQNLIGESIAEEVLHARTRASIGSGSRSLGGSMATSTTFGLSAGMTGTNFDLSLSLGSSLQGTGMGNAVSGGMVRACRRAHGESSPSVLRAPHHSTSSSQLGCHSARKGPTST
jgi:hypothetical protein